MRVHFQEKPWDLIAAVAYTLVLAATLLILNVGNILAILFMFFFPGYVLVAALFPGSRSGMKPDLDWIERLVFSIGSSVAVVPLLGLILNLTPFGIRFAPIVASIALFTVGVGYTAYWRRMQLPAGRRLSLTLNLALPDWKRAGAFDKGLTLALVSSIVVAGGTIIFVVLAPRPAERFTDFYVLGPGGNASGYPTALKVSQPGTIILGIANHESTSVAYTVRIDLVGVQVVYNVTSGSNMTVEINRTMWSSFSVTLADGRNWTQSETFSITSVGLWKVQFVLFRDNEFSSAYRELHFIVRVT